MIPYITNVQGIWSGMIGGTVMQTLILLWYTYRTDWNKEVTSHLSYIVLHHSGSAMWPNRGGPSLGSIS